MAAAQGNSTAQKLDQPGGPDAPVTTPNWQPTLLKRTGAKALNFAGVCLVDATGYSRAQPFWFEINLHARKVGGYVVSIRLFNKSPEAEDTYACFHVADFNEAADAIEAHIPSPPDHGSLENEAYPQIDETIYAAARRAQATHLLHAYRALSGEVLYALAQWTHDPLSRARAA